MNASSARLPFAILACAILALSLAFAPSPAAGLSESNATARYSDSEIDEIVSSLIVAGDYAESEAIVCYLDEGTQGMSAQSDDAPSALLAGAETLSTVTARQYAEATGDVVASSSGPGTLTAQSAEEPVGILLVYRPDMTTEQLLRELLQNPQVLSAEPNYIMQFDDNDMPSDTLAAGSVEALTEPSDTSGSTLSSLSDDDTSIDLTEYQWFSEGVNAIIPEFPNASNPGIHAPNWNDPNKTNANGVVVIMDSGIDYTHPDLAGVMYQFTPAQQEELGCGEFGYAPRRENPKDPMDGLNHGTHCAGIVAAQWNDFGVSGIANGVKLCAVSVSRSTTDGSFGYDAIIKGYDFMIRAVESGVDIRSVNRSLSCSPINNANEAMMKAAGDVGIVTCVASGNESRDLDVIEKLDSAADQTNPYILRVNAGSLQDDCAIFSNYGATTTDVSPLEFQFSPPSPATKRRPSGISS